MVHFLKIHTRLPLRMDSMLYCIVNSKRIIFQLILIISKDVIGFFPSLIVNRIMKQGYATLAKFFMILAHCTSQSLAKTNNVMFCISHQSKNDDVTVSSASTQYRLLCSHLLDSHHPFFFSSIKVCLGLQSTAQIRHLLIMMMKR